MPLQSPPQLGSHAGKEGADGNPSCSFLKERETALSTRAINSGKSFQAGVDTKPTAKQQCIDLPQV